MREGWEIKTLGEVCEKASSNVSQNQLEKENGKYPIYGASGFIKNISFYHQAKPYLSIVKDGSGVGRVTKMEAFSSVIGTLQYILPNDGIDLDYLNYSLMSVDFKKYVSGAAIPHIYFKDYKNEPFLWMPLPEQKGIVALLDETFAAINKAKANAERNLRNTKEFFIAHLRALFNQAEGRDRGKRVTGKESSTKVQSLLAKHEVLNVPQSLNSDNGATKTGGRDATLRHIPGDLSLSVGIPNHVTKPGWRWTLLSELAKLESGHTPSRRHPEYWGGKIPWIGIQDARENHGQIIYDTFQHTNELGIKNSSARILPRNTVCLSRTASVGYVVIMGNPMSTSQDFVNWICGPSLLPDFLKYLFLAEGREGLYRFSSGAVHQTIYFPEAKAFCICHPGTDEQKRIVLICDSIRAKTKKLEAIYQKKINDLEELKKSVLQKAFAGELTDKTMPELT